jgi:hypothetical protein
MRSHRLTFDSEVTFPYRAGAYLALAVETYAHFVGEKADGLDLRAHLQRQGQALTVLAWDVRQPEGRIRFVVIPENEPAERLMPSGRQPFAQGWLRTFGRLCLAGNELLEACAHDPDHDLFHANGKSSKPLILEVPPGTYSALVYAGGESEPNAAESPDIVILRHYPFPPPRIAPVRLSGLKIEETGE